jgi:hypothetical protein
VEFYIISGGLEEVIKGSKIARWFSGIWGCRFQEDDGQIRHVMNSVSFTEKTKYIFSINKGLHGKARSDPYAVNKKIETADRRIPFENMIYVGDGLTDVPCFSLLNANGGRSFGVFDPRKKESPKKAWEQLVAPQRVVSAHSPRYRPDDDLGAFLKMAVESICSKLDLRAGIAVV